MELDSNEELPSRLPSEPGVLVLLPENLENLRRQGAELVPVTRAEAALPGIDGAVHRGGFPSFMPSGLADRPIECDELRGRPARVADLREVRRPDVPGARAHRCRDRATGWRASLIIVVEPDPRPQATVTNRDGGPCNPFFPTGSTLVGHDSTTPGCRAGHAPATVLAVSAAREGGERDGIVKEASGSY